MNICFKETYSSLTPEPDRQTTFGIHKAGTERFLQRLVAAGMTLQPDGAFTDDTLPMWSVMRARRWAKEDPTLPQPIKLTPGCCRWRLSEIEAWEQSKRA